MLSGLGMGEEPLAPTGSKANLGFSGGGGSCGILPAGRGGGGAVSASILGGSIAGAGRAATGGPGTGGGGRKRGAGGTGAGGATLRTSSCLVILPRFGSFCVSSLGR